MKQIENKKAEKKIQVLKVMANEIRTPANPRKQVPPCDESGKLRYHSFSVDIPKDARVIEAILAKLPPGKIRLMGALSSCLCKFKNQGYLINIGWLGYKIPLIGLQPRDLEGLDVGIKKPTFNIGSKLPLKSQIFETDEGLHICALMAGSFVKGDSIQGYIIYVKD